MTISNVFEDQKLSVCCCEIQCALSRPYGFEDHNLFVHFDDRLCKYADILKITNCLVHFLETICGIGNDTMLLMLNRVEISLKLSWARFHYNMHMCYGQQRLLQDPWYNLDRKQRLWFGVA